MTCTQKHTQTPSSIAPGSMEAKKLCSVDIFHFLDSTERIKTPRAPDCQELRSRVRAPPNL